MPPRLPRLTLFTGGKECGLCEVAKANLVAVRHTHPFEIKVWNIREPPADVGAEDVHKWRRAYQYEIVSTNARRAGVKGECDEDGAGFCV
ncbi:hypothetical protein CC85DRAFT_288103 [Cutaneotrichosporon oleaginosum]|uniref:Glutaredoxin-like protein n=1 Tax=Cutaneotrichosporon oleaginosum TaxID=879819 RepID=A0A0J0XFL3_9TREE|nr:uncharacterized protein CC85DRAFT_288103 [Cutaneotrichosporon oleaginosum]KLT39846.1 hypothetical protein CC85DRAFT_288103 [Cutaneotrichosporon oleaginosum]TXT05443.1 hypothetical protein COLE_06763 [Cutaneotrichosporon oleaginosum]